LDHDGEYPDTMPQAIRKGMMQNVTFRIVSVSIFDGCAEIEGMASSRSN
jgi:hypothetical protein